MALDFLKLAKDVSWDSFKMPELGQHYGTEPNKWLGIPLIKAALADDGAPVLTASGYGNLIARIDQLLESLQKIANLRIIKLDRKDNNNQTVLMASKNTMISISTSSRGKSADASLVTNDQEIFKNVTALLSRVLVPEDTAKGLVFTLASGMNGYSITRLGVAGADLERGNYSPEVLADYDHIVADLNTDSPCGRLVILSGPPGTGKTFLVRSLLAQAKKSAFILIPPHLVKDLNGPEILPALIDAKRESKGSIVLVIEDADQVLVKREDGDMGAISSLLNLGDGILGSVLDVRILATTNATQLQIDPATMRPGRLCRHTIIEDLNPETATAAIQRLTKKPFRYEQPATIAQVYVDARKNGWRPAEIVPESGSPERPEILG